MFIFIIVFFVVFFFKQKTAYEMRISDWSSDVCSSDLIDADQHLAFGRAPDNAGRRGRLDRDARQLRGGIDQRFERQVDARRDDPAAIGAVGADMVKGRRGAKADDKLVPVRSSEARRVGKEGGSTCRYRGSPYHKKKKNK